ncbi:unnamed protein product [Moneuplotes crassus]|uniref:Uncharacterized protein n=1 Tax=Euplotes crassus TaxID=5936 RepID=A0AAD1U6D0_EUPCR|nr:unnamed protein product [Moneuplotes crassus]
MNIVVGYRKKFKGEGLQKICNYIKSSDQVCLDFVDHPCVREAIKLPILFSETDLKLSPILLCSQNSEILTQNVAKDFTSENSQNLLQDVEESLTIINFCNKRHIEVMIYLKILIRQQASLIIHEISDTGD